MSSANNGGMGQLHRHSHSGNPAIPPRNGKSPFLKLPAELRRKILLDFLPTRDIIYQPGGATASASVVEVARPRVVMFGRIQVPIKNTYRFAEKLVRNTTARICNILVLNRQLLNEFTTVIYEERTFGVDVHEGVYSGGIKFLNSGLQRLQHKDNFQICRFKRFDDDDAFGLARIKRLVITVHPCTDKRTATSRHDPIYTHFMTLALVKLLEVQVAKREITYLKIKLLEPEPEPEEEENLISFTGAFAPRKPVIKSEPYWWNTATQSPRATSVHALSNVELILRPFYRLYRVHKAEIELPESMAKDKSMQAFKTHLIGAMTSKGGQMVWDDELDHKIEAARDCLDEWLFTMKFGNGGGVPDKDIWLADEIVNENFPEEKEAEEKKKKMKCSIDVAFEEYRAAWMDKAGHVENGTKMRFYGSGLGPRERLGSAQVDKAAEMTGADAKVAEKLIFEDEDEVENTRRGRTFKC